MRPVRRLGLIIANGDFALPMNRLPVVVPAQSPGLVTSSPAPAPIVTAPAPAPIPAPVISSAPSTNTPPPVFSMSTVPAPVPQTQIFQGGPMILPMTQPAPVALPMQNPDTLPGAWPGLNPAPAPTQVNILPVTVPTPQPVTFLGPPAQAPATQPTTANTLPAQVPVGQPTVIVTPTSGPIPSPQSVAAAAAPASWFDQQMIPGVKNSYLVLGGLGLLVLFGGRKKK
jgi:hypothetical protein